MWREGINKHGVGSPGKSCFVSEKEAEYGEVEASRALCKDLTDVQ